MFNPFLFKSNLEDCGFQRKNKRKGKKEEKKEKKGEKEQDREERKKEKKISIPIFLSCEPKSPLGVQWEYFRLLYFTNIQKLKVL